MSDHDVSYTALGEELAYVTVTTSVTVSGTSGSPTTVATAPAILCSGNARFLYEFYCAHARAASGDEIYCELVEDGSVVTQSAGGVFGGASQVGQALKWEFYKTPSSGRHIYAIAAYRSASNGTLYSTTDGFAPIYFRISKA